MFILNAYKKLIKRFKSPTPAKWRKFGQCALNWSMAIAAPPSVLGYQWIALIIFLIGVFGRTIVEFTTEENDK